LRVVATKAKALFGVQKWLESTIENAPDFSIGLRVQESGLILDSSDAKASGKLSVGAAFLASSLTP
jgi:hypothetical protein